MCKQKVVAKGFYHPAIIISNSNNFYLSQLGIFFLLFLFSARLIETCTFFKIYFSKKLKELVWCLCSLYGFILYCNAQAPFSTFKGMLDLCACRSFAIEESRITCSKMKL